MSHLAHPVSEVNDFLAHCTLLCAEQRSDEAVAKLKRLSLGFGKKDALVWLVLGEAYFSDYRYIKAKQAVLHACKLAPKSPAIHFRAATLCNHLGDTRRALALVEKFKHLDPKSALGAVERARILERMHRFDEAEAEVEEGLKRDPDSIDCRIMSAMLHRRAKKYSEAEVLLRDALGKNPSQDQRIKLGYELAATLDKAGDYENAFHEIGETKRPIAQTRKAVEMKKVWEMAVAQTKSMLKELSRKGLGRWRSAAEGLPHFGEMPPLLLGHPRSGTTLLEQVLDSHSGIATLDEANVMAQKIIMPLRTLDQGNPEFTHDDFVTQSIASQAGLRRSYEASAAKTMGRRWQRDVVIDKHPSHTVDLPWILTAVPETRMIVSLRDPRDIVISCLFLTVPINRFSINWLDLESAARAYDETFRIWADCVELLDADQRIQVRYEDVVEDLGGEGKRLTEWLGLDWEGSQSRFYEHAESKVVRSPTYESVNQPVYRSAVSRWHNYESHLGRATEILSPWLERFGYS